MHLLVSGANGYIGLRLIQALIEAGHRVTAVVRDPRRFPVEGFVDGPGSLEVATADFLEAPDPSALPRGVDAAYYLIHSMGAGGDFEEREARCARNFALLAAELEWRRILYLGGITPEGESPLSPHLRSRKEVENLLAAGPVPLATLRASVIVGSGSASFEIIRDLCEKLPVLVTPRWVRTRCQPIAIRNVIDYLTGLLEHSETLGRSYDIGGPEVLAYRELLVRYCRARNLRRLFLSTRVLTPRLSSLWLFLMTSASFPLARALVDSLVVETVCRDETIRERIPVPLLTYDEAVERALVRIAQNRVPSSWVDALATGTLPARRFTSIQVPEHGVCRDSQQVPLAAPAARVIERIWSLGGRRGWPSMNWAWKLRGTADRMLGGTGMRRGRRHPDELRSGDALDFWRVLLADRPHGRLILYAEMKLPGEAWLEFAIETPPDGPPRLRQTATFRPHGLRGRLYWWLVLPFHLWLFPRMARRLAAAEE